MIKKEHTELARRLCVNAMKSYRERFIHDKGFDLISGVDREAILVEIDKIIAEVKFDEAGRLSIQNRELRQRLDHLASLEDCDEEFEM